MNDTFYNLLTARDVDAFDCYTGGEMLTEVKRAEDTDDGKDLICFCNDVRKRGIEAVRSLCIRYPKYEIEGDAIYNMVDSSIISMRNSDINERNSKVIDTFQIDASKQEQIKQDLMNIIMDDSSMDVAIEQAKIQLSLNYPDLFIKIVARETFTYNKHTIYNGTRGTLRNNMMTFNDMKIPLTEIRIPTHRTKLNPFKHPTLFCPKIQPVYAITSYRAQGRTLEENIIIDCRVVSDEMLYVAVSRATRLSQLHFILEDDTHEREEPECILKARATSDLQTGFKVSNASTIFVDDKRLTPEQALRLDTDLSKFGWNDYFDKARIEYNALVVKFKSQRPIWKTLKVHNELKRLATNFACGSLIQSKHWAMAYEYITDHAVFGLITKPELGDVFNETIIDAIDEVVRAQHPKLATIVEEPILEQEPIVAQEIIPTDHAGDFNYLYSLGKPFFKFR